MIPNPSESPAPSQPLPDRTAGASSGWRQLWAVPQGTSFEIAYRMTRRDGAVRWVQDRGRAVYGEDGRLRLAVEDTGIGMASADIPKALSPFGQIDSAHNRRHGGTGLGLPLTKRLVEAHDATFDLKSELAVGTVVTVEFPPHRLVDRFAPRSAAAP